MSTSTPRGGRASGRCALTMLIGGAALALSAGCAVGPEYRGAPPVDIGAGWSEPVGSTRAAVDLEQWWTSFGDPTLDRLIAQAHAGNLDLKVARARMAEARALREAAGAGGAPVIDVGASVERRRQSLNGPLPIGAIPGVERDQTVHQAQADVAWELDLFGRNRRAVEQARSSAEAVEADAEALRLSVAAETARTYWNLRGAQLELAARRDAVATLRRTRDLIGQRAAVGDLAQIDLDEVEASLGEAEALLPAIEGRARAAALGIALLTGRPPEAGIEIERTPATSPRLARFPVGERADLLRRRPDVIAAERRLAASSAAIGHATAELFPRLSIGARGGFQSLSLGNLFSAGSQIASLVPAISWRVFDGGRVRAEIRVTEARERAAAAAYEKTVLTALGEAEGALASYHRRLESISALETAVAASRQQVVRAQKRFALGDVPQTYVLEAQRRLHDLDGARVRARTEASGDLVDLFKALGGGWSHPDAGGTPAPG